MLDLQEGMTGSLNHMCCFNSIQLKNMQYIGMQDTFVLPQCMWEKIPEVCVRKPLWPVQMTWLEKSS